MSVGYARGAKIIDQLEEKGIIGPSNGSKPREILINRQQWLEMQAYGSTPDFTAENTEQMSFDMNKEEVIGYLDKNDDEVKRTSSDDSDFDDMEAFINDDRFFNNDEE